MITLRRPVLAITLDIWFLDTLDDPLDSIGRDPVTGPPPPADVALNVFLGFVDLVYSFILANDPDLGSVLLDQFEVRDLGRDLVRWFRSAGWAVLVACVGRQH